MAKQSIETMDKVSIKDVDFKNEELAQAMQLLLDNDYTVIFSPNQLKSIKGVTYAHYSKGNNIAYVQGDDFGHGIKISTEHKPNPNCGTGFGLYEDAIDTFTLKTFENGFISAPNWATMHDRESVVKYNGFEDFFKITTNNIITYSLLTK